MANISPNDDVIAIAASNLAGHLARIREQELRGKDAPTQEQHLLSYYRWAVDVITAEHRSTKPGAQGGSVEFY